MCAWLGLVGVAIWKQKSESKNTLPADGLAKGQYVNRSFGLVFQTHPETKKVERKGNRLEGDLSGYIERYDIKAGQSVRDAVTDLIWADIHDRFNDPAYDYFSTCDLSYVPYLPHEINAVMPGQIGIRVNALKGYEFYDQLAAKDSKKVYGNEDPGLDYYTFYNDHLAADCSHYALDGYFLYDPVNAPERFYYVYNSKNGGEAWFFQPQTIQILPD